MSSLFSFIFCVANGEPPIGIPWETHLYSKCEPVEAIPYAFWAGE